MSNYSTILYNKGKGTLSCAPHRLHFVTSKENESSHCSLQCPKNAEVIRQVIRKNLVYEFTGKELCYFIYYSGFYQLLHIAHKNIIYILLKVTAGILAISHFIEKFLKFVTSCLGSFFSTLIICPARFHLISLLLISPFFCVLVLALPSAPCRSSRNHSNLHSCPLLCCSWAFWERLSRSCLAVRFLDPWEQHLQYGNTEVLEGKVLSSSEVKWSVYLEIIKWWKRILTAGAVGAPYIPLYI